MNLSLSNKIDIMSILKNIKSNFHAGRAGDGLGVEVYGESSGKN
jgi:hypothetical protein